MFDTFLEKVTAGGSLSAAESEQAIHSLLEGQVADETIIAFLTALHQRGETEDEVLGAVRALRGKMLPFEAPPHTIDCCGTGGDNLGTYNISTAAAFVIAGAGVRIAKHGNRSVSSRSGSSDVLRALGVKIDAAKERMQMALKEAYVCFLLAPLYHPAMQKVANARSLLGHRSIFNLLGPLANPANVKRQMVGVFDRKWLEPFARILSQLGSDKVIAVHGEDGLDEITTTTLTQVVDMTNGKTRAFSMSPPDVGLRTARLIDLQGGDTVQNAEKIKELLEGEPGPYRDIVVLNAAAGLIAAGKTDNWTEAVAFAADSLDSRRAQNALKKLIEISNG